MCEVVIVVFSLLDFPNTAVWQVLLSINIERGLLASFELDFEVVSLNVLETLDVDFSIHNVAWLVERELSLDLNSSVGEHAPRIAKEEHIKIFYTKIKCAHSGFWGFGEIGRAHV